MAQSIGFIGLGIMGQPMALNLAQAGHKLAVYNRTRSKAEPLERAGARVVASPAEAAREADVIITIVSDSAAVEEVVSGKDGVLEAIRSGAVLIDSSTISPVVSRKLACHVAGKGARMLDAPVTGSKHGAEKGELTFMIGGERETLERAMEVLKVLGKKHIYCGENGKGLAAKLSMNAILATTIAIFSEGFVAATKAGVDPQVLLEIMQSSLARSAIVDFKAPFVFRGWRRPLLCGVCDLPEGLPRRAYIKNRCLRQGARRTPGSNRFARSQTSKSRCLASQRAER